MTRVTFSWQHSCCYGKVCINIKRWCQTACLHWDTQALEGGKSAKIFYTLRKRNVWLIIVLLRRKPWEIHLYLICTTLQVSEETKAPNSTELFANIRKTFENTNGLAGILRNYSYLGLPRKQDKAQKHIFLISVMPKRLHWLHWFCRTFGMSKAYESRK